MTTAAHNLSIHPSTRQPDLRADAIAIHRAAPVECYGYWRNAGQYDLSIKSYANKDGLSLKDLAAALRVAFPRLASGPPLARCLSALPWRCWRSSTPWRPRGRRLSHDDRGDPVPRADWNREPASRVEPGSDRGRGPAPREAVPDLGLEDLEP